MSLDLTAEAGETPIYGAFNSGDIPVNTDFTMFCWIKRNPLWSSSWNHPMTLSTNIAVPEDTCVTFNIEDAVSIKLYQRESGSTTETSSVTVVNTEVDDIWIPVMFSYRYTGVGDEDYYLYAHTAGGTVNETVEGAGQSFGNITLDGLILGERRSNAVIDYNGLISHVCIWEGKTLTSANFDTLKAGVAPSTVESGSIKAYYPLIENLIDYSGNSEVTLTEPAASTYSLDEPFSASPSASDHTVQFSEAVTAVSGFAEGMSFVKNAETGIVSATTTGTATNVIYSVLYATGAPIAGDVVTRTYSDIGGDIINADGIKLASFTAQSVINCEDP